MVFKLERERPAYTIHQNTLLFVTKEKFVRSYDLNTSTESSNMISLRKLGYPWNPPRSISYNAADRSVLVSSSVDGGVYELINLPRDGGSVVEGSNKRGEGTTAVWVARNRFAVFSKDIQTIDIKDLSNSVTRSIKPSQTGVMDIHAGSVAGTLLLSTQNQVVLYDIQKKETIAELMTPFVKYVYWSTDGNQVALLGKHTIATKNLEQVCSIHETIRIKSAVWDDTLGVLLYSTLNHVKYLLPSPGVGDTGVIRTLANTVYLIRVRGKSLTCLTREAKVEVSPIDPTEYRFKVALAKKDYKEMVRVIKTSNLVGQSIIAYLQKKGYSEVLSNSLAKLILGCPAIRSRTANPF
jgi:coatomer subunit alpha